DETHPAPDTRWKTALHPVERRQQPVPARRPRSRQFGGTHRLKDLPNEEITWCPGSESNRYVPFGTRDFKSRASASFATRAGREMFENNISVDRVQFALTRSVYVNVTYFLVTSVIFPCTLYNNAPFPAAG